MNRSANELSTVSAGDRAATAIRVSGLCKLRPSPTGGSPRTVLDGVDLEVARGEVLALVGPSGGGKTTLLRCLNALERFEAGSIEVAGERLAAGPRSSRSDDACDRRLRARVGMVFQGYHLFPHLTAVENVALAPSVAQRRARHEARREAEELLTRVGLAHRAHARPTEMSGGEQQRVAIARALATRPEVLLLDEPTAALDPERREEVLAVVRSLRDAGHTLVVVTHEVAFAREAADRAALLDGGQVVEHGPARALLTAPSTKRAQDFLRLAHG